MSTESAPAAARHALRRRPHGASRTARSIPLAVGCAVGFAFSCALAVAQPVRPVAWANPAVEREALRAQILSDERQQQRERLAEVRMRLAERLNAGDTRGAEETRYAITRIEASLESLGREIERAPARVPARPVTGDPVPSPAVPAVPRFTAPSVMPVAPTQPAPWWDVYGAAARPRASAAPAVAPDPLQARPALQE
jgi:hypothetical protein